MNHRYSAPAPNKASRSSAARSSLVAATMACILAVAGVQVAFASSTLLNGLRLVESSYLFADQLDPKRLLRASLEYLESRIPELHASAVSTRGSLVEAGPCSLYLELPSGSRLVALADELSKVAVLIQGCVSHKPKGLPQDAALLLAAVLDGLDPYSRVFDAAGKTEHTIQFRGRLAGIGARIGIRDERLTLITVYNGTPAYAAGLRDGDIVRRIDGVSATNMQVHDAVQRIRGRAGTVVRLLVEHPGESKLKAFPVTRGIVMIPSVTARLLDSGVVDANISHFSQTTPADFRDRVGKIVAEHEVRGVIVDLRANSGGSMLGSAAIGDLFLNRGVLITTAGRLGEPVGGLTPEIDARDDTPFASLPVAILTSPRTASGSELFAASLRNHDRSILVGQRSFGKGTVQKTYSLGAETSLKLTVGRFLPNGMAIPGGGLLPDVEIYRYRFHEQGVRLPAGRVREEDLPFWLRTPEGIEVSRSAVPLVISFADQESESPGEKQPKNDPDLEIADEILSRYGSTSASTMLEAARPFLLELKARRDAELRRFLAGKGIDWRAAPKREGGKAEPQLRITMAWENGQPLSAGNARIQVTVTNNGSSPLFRLRGVVESEAAFLDGRGLLFGYIAPGRSRSWSFDTELPRWLHTARLEAHVLLEEEDRVLAKSGPILLAVNGAKQPRLAYRVSVEPGGEPAELKLLLDLDNRGDAPARDVHVILKHPDVTDYEIVRGTATIEQLEPGQQARAEFSVRLLQSTAETIMAELAIAEPETRLFLESSLPLRITKEPARWHEPPRIELTALHAGDGSFRLRVRATDDAGLVSLLSRVDGEQYDYLESYQEPARQLSLSLPWNPHNGVQRFEVLATDNEQLRTVYSTQL